MSTRTDNGLDQMIDVQLRSIGIDPGNVTPKDRQAIWDKHCWLCIGFEDRSKVAEPAVIREATITGLGHERIAQLRENGTCHVCGYPADENGCSRPC